VRYLKQNTAVTIVVGPFVDWKNAKSLLRVDADFVPAKITCELIKGNTSSTLTLTKTGGDNDIVLTGKGLATLELTAANVDTLGQLRLCFADAMISGYPTQTILTFVEDFSVLPANVYDSLFGTSKLQVDILTLAGFTSGGTLTIANLLKSLAAFIEGTYKLKAGTTDTWQVSDADDKDVNVLEIQLKENADPYKQVTRL